MQLHTLDWVIALLAVTICFAPALFFGKRSGKNTAEFFASGRSVPWWLAGLSMVATTFSSDTPNLVANFVRTEGVAGNWRWWAFTLTGVSTVFFYARMWRRSGVLTDLEFYELRYSGRAAGAVRGFRSVYLGLLFNCIIMATVNLAACKIAAILFGFERWQTLLFVGLLNVVFATHSGLWGVLVIDMVQFFIKMSAVIAAAYFAVELPQVGGLSGLMEKLSHLHGPHGVNYLNMLPDFTNNWDLAMAVFIIPITVQWWASWYPGAEPGGGSYIAQRMLASKSEKDALGSTLFFNVAHYVLRPWPWILVGLASLVVYPQLSDIQTAFPHLDPKLLGHDIAFPAMLRFLPAGWMGLMLGGLVAANSSTILTHLNWGASYLVHDFYRRFLNPGAPEKHYVAAGRVATVILFLASSAMVFALDTAKDSFDVILQIGAGTGLLYLVRWFWWRVTAWCEIVAMVSSFGISILFLIVKKLGTAPGTYRAILITIGLATVFWVFTSRSATMGLKIFSSSGLALLIGILSKMGPVPGPAPVMLVTIEWTTVLWVLTAFLGPQTSDAALLNFYRKVRPPGPGWRRVQAIAGISPEQAAADREAWNFPMSLLGWFTGCITIWSALFTVGNFLYGRMDYFWAMLAIFVVSGAILMRVVNRLWT